VATDFILPLFRINLVQKTNLQLGLRALEEEFLEGLAY
jgi:hypothetical protein